MLLIHNQQDSHRYSIYVAGTLTKSVRLAWLSGHADIASNDQKPVVADTFNDDMAPHEVLSTHDISVLAGPCEQSAPQKY